MDSPVPRRQADALLSLNRLGDEPARKRCMFIAVKRHGRPVCFDRMRLYAPTFRQVVVYRIDQLGERR